MIVKHENRVRCFTLARVSSVTRWSAGRLTSPFGAKIRHIGDKVLGGDLLPPD